MTNPVKIQINVHRRKRDSNSNLFEEFFLEQYVEEATRANNILDIFATNDPEFILNTSVENVDRRTSDHKFMIIKTRMILNINNILPPENTYVLATPNFWSRDIDWPAIKSELSRCNWVEVLDSPDIDNIAATILNQLEEICPKFVPPKVDTRRSIIPRDRRVLMRKRKKLRTRLIGTRDPRKLNSIERNLEEIDAKLVDSHEVQQAREELIAVEKIQENSKFFFGYARSKSKIKSPIGPLIANNQTVTNPLEMSEILKEQFESVFNTETVLADVDEILSLKIPLPRFTVIPKFNC